jgi:prepilin-type N-terminal cleavage/methylation domain-containing protein
MILRLLPSRQWRHSVQQNNMSTYNTKQKGFTLVETMVAVFILTIALASLLTLTASSIFSARYARNEITANYLLQEAADYIKNDRDTVVFNQNTGGTGWTTFLNKYGYSSSGVCFSSNGCYFEPANMSSVPPTVCISGTCPKFNYDNAATYNTFYTYKSPSVIVPSIFSRKIQMSVNSSNADELDVSITVNWTNGSLGRSRSLQISLLNWQKTD